MVLTASGINSLKQNSGDFEPVPNDLLLYMLSFLNPKELKTLEQTCQFLKAQCNQEKLWDFILNKFFPDIKKPEGESAKKFFYYLKSGARLRQLFEEENPGVTMEVPLMKIEPVSFMTAIKKRKKVKWRNICFSGTDEQIKKNFSNNPISMSKKYSDTAELIKLVNLSLNNKANPNAFKTFMSGLSDEVKIKLFKYRLTSSNYFYLYLQYLRKIGSFEIEKNIPLIITLAQQCEGFTYERFLKFIIAYDKTALSMRDSNNNTVFHLICAKPHINPQLVKYFVEEVSRVKPELLTDINSHGETGVVLLAKNLLKFTNPDFNYCLQIQAIIRRYPRLLEMKEKKSSCLRTADILLACTVNIKEEKIGELQTLFELIDRYFLTQHNVSLLHMTLRTQHAINKLWLEKHSTTVVQGKKYVDLIDEKGRGLLAVAFEAKTIDIEIVAMLLKAGVDPDFESSPGKKPLWEFSKDHSELHALVKESYEKRDKPLPLSEEEKNIWIKMLILENKKLTAAMKTKPTMCDKETQTQDELLNYSLAV